MYPGYIAMGAEDPFNGQASVEVVNNERAYIYAEAAGICWLNRCEECPDIAIITPGGPRYETPVKDPAPWFDPKDPDTWGFLGVIGLEVTGADDSTRTSNVSMSLSGRGVIGPMYLQPREMVVRALAIATDDCALQRGLIWLRGQYQQTENACGGDPMTFFDCCPCVCDDTAPAGPCWAANYGELRGGPTACRPIWWPTTYAEVKTGPPDFDEWCVWPSRYRHLRTGPPPWTCCIDTCVAPYMRQFHNCRVVTGPTILQRPVLHTDGAVAEIEFTIVAADPVPHSMPYSTVRTTLGPTGTTYSDPLPARTRVNRFQLA